MKRNLATKLIQSHLVSGTLAPGEEIALRIDQTLTQDATGTIVYLQFAILGLDTVKTELSTSYVDHNLLQTDFRNADDHRYLKSVAERYGIYFSPPGNGVSHQVHMERFGAPGKTLLGSDSHTSTAGALGMLAIGAGGLDVALAMAGEPFYLEMPRVLGVMLTGRLPAWVSAKDVVLEMLRRHGVKGGVGRIVEYYGPGVITLSATDRATIANMGAELGATTSIFPSDERTLKFLTRQGRADSWTQLETDFEAEYDETDEIDLSTLEPLIACPTSPGNVKKVTEVEGTPIGQAIIGSSVNSSFRDLMVVCRALETRTIGPGVSLEINPGSRQVLENVERAGGLHSLIHAGARIQQSGCLGCIGMGQAPATGTNSIRTFPRNFPGRSGTENDSVYLASPETSVASAIFGVITDPRKLGEYPEIVEPDKYVYNDKIIEKPLPPAERARVEIISGPNITPFPEFDPLPADYEGEVLLKVGDDVTTDHIMPAGNEVLPLRSNVPLISEHSFERIERGFAERCRAAGGGIVIGGENYGQGSSREHAAVGPRFLGVRIKIVRSFARIHLANLINFGIVPLLFKEPEDYDRLKLGDRLRFKGLRRALKEGSSEVEAHLDDSNMAFEVRLTTRQREAIIAGGLLNLVKKGQKNR